MVCQQIRVFLPDNFTIDWVGTGPFGRSDRENTAVLRDFCPSKDKLTHRRHWTLDILVNVGMAGEGLDTTDITESVFLTPANKTITNDQIIGRASRRMYGRMQPPAHINVDTGSPLAEFIGERIMGYLDNIEIKKPEGGDPRGPEIYDPLPDSMQIIDVDVHLTDIRRGELWEVALEAAKGAASSITPQEDMERAAEAALRDHLNRANNVSNVLARKRDQIDIGVTKLAGLAIREIGQSGILVEKSLAGRLRRRINLRKSSLYGSVKTASEEQLLLHWKWLKDLEREILTNGLPSWLRSEFSRD